MNIPTSFYFKYWAKNSLLALGTGVLVSFLIPPLFVLVPYLPIIFCALYQVIIFNNFLGKRDGDFEYYYMEHLIKKKSNQYAKKYLGRSLYFSYLLDKINNAISTAWDAHQKLLNLKEVIGSDEILFYVYMIGADLSQKEDDTNREKRFLLNAIQLKPNNLVANYRLAVVLEKEGLSIDSIEKYQAATTDPKLSSKRLREHINNQIKRIKEFGPRKSPPIPGLKYMSW